MARQRTHFCGFEMLNLSIYTGACINSSVFPFFPNPLKMVTVSVCSLNVFYCICVWGFLFLFFQNKMGILKLRLLRQIAENMLTIWYLHLVYILLFKTEKEIVLFMKIKGSVQ